MIDVRVQSADFDPGRQLERLRELGRGAVASLLGIAEADGDVTSIVVEHYAAMARVELGRIADEAQGRWPLSGIILIHRHGSFGLGDRILFVGAASSDHQAAAEACAYLARSVRERAPFWRKERLAGGTSRWTERLPSAARQPV
ncbi:molybdenum cofactor biosynthesis protein MoaE [Allosphingosinicella sp.]|uniref:molybdenum cofactor biosynthesis protein MoaE n=1 Tax=Allosphingosinicella sp. TaxID=2823234 RepID=UPI002FC18641